VVFSSSTFYFGTDQIGIDCITIFEHNYVYFSPTPRINIFIVNAVLSASTYHHHECSHLGHGHQNA